jgi:bifunctional DNA-binding transcriptional regulator/antitoxin component of YhaV-PrlF toxin-antitoxin module
MDLTTVIVSHDPGIARHVDRVVAVRDGKLATETVRQGEAAHGEAYQELVVLDSAGRLQVPKEYLERFGIKRRVQLEPTSDGILIRPVEHEGSEAGVGARPATEPQAGPLRGWRGLVARWRRSVETGRDR